jgi:hypothetical protein
MSVSDDTGDLWHLGEGGLPYEIWPFLGKSLKSTVAVGNFQESLQQQKQNLCKNCYFKKMAAYA